MIAGYVTYRRLKIRPPEVLRNSTDNRMPQEFAVRAIRQNDDSVAFLVRKEECTKSTDADATVSKVAMQ
jgi:hypothetical protein